MYAKKVAFQSIRQCFTQFSIKQFTFKFLSRYLIVENYASVKF